MSQIPMAFIRDWEHTRLIDYVDKVANMMEEERRGRERL